MVNCTSLKIVGVVDRKIGENNALIRILAVNHDGTLSQNLHLIEVFPPNGEVFGPSFFIHNPKIQEGELIDFECQENATYTGCGNHTKYIVRKGSVTKNNYIKTYNLASLPLQDRYADIKKISCEEIDCSNYFCVSDGPRVLGKLRVQKNGLEPVVKKRVHVWNRGECDVIEDGRVSYVKLPQGECIAYDCMEESRLFEWFRDKLRKINPEYVKLLDNKTVWRKEFPEFFDKSDEESLELDQYRLARVMGKIDGIELSIQDIKALMDASESLRAIFRESIEHHKASFLSDYEKELSEYQKTCDQKKSLLKEELKKTEKQINQKKIHLDKLETQRLNSQKEIDHILKNKERILSDFSIVRDALNINPPSTKKCQDSCNSAYVLENVDKNEQGAEVKEKAICLGRIGYFLNNYKLNRKLASRFLNIILCYKGIFIENIAYGVALAEALGNTKYIIQQVEPDWLHFNRLWENGLGELWLSSHENPDIMHLLLLEDINLASPECYARPLLDVMRGIRKRIPYAKSEMPDNLRVLATKMPFEDPPIGLPLYPFTFYDWGAIGFQKNSIPDENAILSPMPKGGYLAMNVLRNFMPDEFEREMIHADIKSDMAYFFENEQ